MNAPQGTLMFRGTTEQLETAGDWLILLSYTRMMRIGRIMGPMVTIFLALAGFVQFREGNPSMFFLYMILTLYVGMTIIRKTSGTTASCPSASSWRGRSAGSISTAASPIRSSTAGPSALRSSATRSCGSPASGWPACPCPRPSWRAPPATCAAG